MSKSLYLPDEREVRAELDFLVLKCRSLAGVLQGKTGETVAEPVRSKDRDLLGDLDTFRAHESCLTKKIEAIEAGADSKSAKGKAPSGKTATATATEKVLAAKGCKDLAALEAQGVAERARPSKSQGLGLPRH
jgi:hypothetical protein